MSEEKDLTTEMLETIERNMELTKKYPFLIPKNRRTGETIEGYDYTWTELDDMPEGWRKAFGEKMMDEILESLKKEGRDPKVMQIVQIKEKYGTLRFYAYGTTEEIDRVIIPRYERMSRYTCISCGKPATKISKGWIAPWCDECAEEMKAKRGKNQEFVPVQVLEEMDRVYNPEYKMPAGI